MDDTVSEQPDAVSKSSRLKGTVLENPKVERDDDGTVISVEASVSVQFKGAVVLRIHGDVASSYWSITQGMSIVFAARQTGAKEFEAESMDVIAPV